MEEIVTIERRDLLALQIELDDYHKICPSPEELKKQIEKYKTFIQELQNTVQIMSVESMWR